MWLRLYRAFAQLLLSEMWRTNREWRQTVTLLREEVVGAIAEVLRAGVASGEFDPDLDVEIAASALFGVVLVVAVDWLVFSPNGRSRRSTRRCSASSPRDWERRGDPASPSPGGHAIPSRGVPRR